MTPEYHYGAPIGKEEADQLFQRFINIRKRALPLIQKALENDPEALRYYCGRPDQDPLLEDWAFVFDKEAMDHIMKKLNAGEAQCVFIFHGAHGAPASTGYEGETVQETAGRPTVMIFPAIYNAAPGPDDFEFKMIAGERDGGQHPGTGGGTKDDVDAEEVVLPAGFKKGQYNP